MKGPEELREVERLPAREALAQAARASARAACESRNARFPAQLESTELSVSADDAATSLGNAALVLSRGAETPAEVRLIAHLVVLGFAADFPSAPETELSSARSLVWLEAHAGLALLAPLLEHLAERDASATGAGPAALRAALTELARGTSSTVLASEALVAAHALSSVDAPLDGELGPTPRGRVGTFFEAVTLWLFAKHAVRLVGRAVLGYRAPARARRTERGFELDVRTELFGRTLRQRSVVVPLSELASISRETRFARAGYYAGLASLALGTYFGAGFFMDALRAPGGSPSLLGIALLLVVGGIAADFAVTSLTGRDAKTSRLLVIPRRGPGFAVLRVEPSLADAMLRRALSPEHHSKEPAASL